MADRKPLPKNSTDKRRVFAVDELRAKYWLSQIKRITGCKTDYALGKFFDENHAKWKNYLNGGQPNEDTLNKVAQKIPHSKSWYIHGPSELKLWNALSSEATIEDLSLILEFSESLDGEIAQFRIDCFNKDVCNSHLVPEDILDAYDSRIDEIQLLTENFLNEPFVEDVWIILKELTQPYIDQEIREFSAKFYDYDEGSRYTVEDYAKLYREEEYKKLELDTIRQKGKRIDHDDQLRLQKLSNKKLSNK